MVIVYHGHGGNAQLAKKNFHIETLWPEAIVVYPQGLPTQGQLTDREGRLPGWQPTLRSENDRDLKFFVALTEYLARYKPSKTYVTGHSNGGAFSYLVLAAYPAKVDAIAVSAAVITKDFRALTPKPIFHVAGTADQLVKWPWQKLMITRLQELNQCIPPGDMLDEDTTLFTAPKGNDLQTYIHTGGHSFPARAPQKIVDFFKKH